MPAQRTFMLAGFHMARKNAPKPSHNALTN